MREATTTMTRTTRQTPSRVLGNANVPAVKQKRRRQRLRHVIVPIVLLFSTAAVFTPVLVFATTTDQPDDSDTTGSNSRHHQQEQPLSSSSSVIITESESAPLHNVTIASDLPQNMLDEIEDSFFDALSRDPSCDDEDCWSPPQSTVSETDGDNDNGDGTCTSDKAKAETAQEMLPLDSSKRSAQDNQDVCQPPVDKHWGSDPVILRMRDKLREAGSVASVQQNDDQGNNNNNNNNKKKESIPKNNRPPVFLLPGLASTRLIAWKYKGCPQHPLLSDIKVLDIAWLNINLIFQMGTFESSCLKDCLTLGLNQSDTDDLESGCKLRPDEGLDAISSLSPGGIGSDLLVGGTNTGKLCIGRSD